MFKVKKFTLIELIVVIAILTVLAGIVIPNIKDVKDDAKTAAFSGILKNTQTAVDMYLVKNKSYPSDTQPKIGEPQQLNFSLLVPKYLREKPKQAGYYAWVDVLYGTTFAYVDSPTGFKNESGTLSWNEVLDAKEYNIYENINVSGAANLKIKKVLQVSGSETTISGLSPDKEYLISTTDYTGNETPLVNGSYLGIESYGDINSETQKNSEKINHAPIPEIVMSPSSLDVITTSDTITWDYTFTDEDGDTIQNVEWDGKQDLYSTEGAYTVRLRVQDSQGTWSDWVEKMFTVISDIGVVKIATGSDHTLLLMEDGTVKSFGQNTLGSLGYTSSIFNPVPTTIPNLTGVIDVSAGLSHSLILLEDGTVKSFGSNRYGQLGYSTNSGTSNANTIPKLITGVTNVLNVYASGDTSYLLLNDGTVKSFGINRFGQLGYGTNIGTFNPNRIPTNISGVSNVKSISASGNHTIFILNDGRVQSCGNNFSGQLGYTVNISTNNPNITPTFINGINSAIDASAFDNHSMLLLNDGTVKSFGLNSFGQLGYGANAGTNTPNPNPITISGLTGVKAVSLGNKFSLVLLEDGSVKSFGLNLYGELGYSENLGLTNPNYIPKTIPNLTNVKQISAGSNFSMYLTSDGAVKSSGINSRGQLGTEVNFQTTKPNYELQIVVE